MITSNFEKLRFAIQATVYMETGYFICALSYTCTILCLVWLRLYHPLLLFILFIQSFAQFYFTFVDLGLGCGTRVAVAQGGRVPPLTAKNLPKIGKKRGKIKKNRGKKEKSGRKGKNLEESVTLPLLTDRAGYATVGLGFCQIRGMLDILVVKWVWKGTCMKCLAFVYGLYCTFNNQSSLKPTESVTLMRTFEIL